MATLKLIADEIGDALNRPFDWMFKERIKSIFRHEAATIIRQAIDKDRMDSHFKTKFIVDISIVDDSNIPCGSSCGTIRSTNKIAPPIRYKTDEPFTFVGKSDGTVVYIFTNLTELPYADLTTPYGNHPIRYVYQNGYIYIKDGGLCGTITNVTECETGGVLVTSINHGLKTGYTIHLVTPHYDGNYIVGVIDDNTFSIVETYTVDDTSGSWTRVLANDACISVEGAYPFGDMLGDTVEGKLNPSIITDTTELPIPEDLIQAIKLKLLSGELSILDNKDKAPDTNLDN
jgi:hypothetical protein